MACHTELVPCHAAKGSVSHPRHPVGRLGRPVAHEVSADRADPALSLADDQMVHAAAVGALAVGVVAQQLDRSTRPRSGLKMGAGWRPARDLFCTSTCDLSGGLNVLVSGSTQVGNPASS